MAREATRFAVSLPPHDVNPLARTLIWAVAFVIAALMFSVGAALVALAVYSPQEAEHVGVAIMENRAISRGLSIFLIVPSIVTLALTERVSGEAAIAALSAIAGYTLASATVSPQ